jgi:hypothetical protein
MERILLYYPCINIPNGDWLRNSLLYTDKVASIVPFDNMNDERINDDTKMLYDEGQYEPISVFNKLDSSHKEFSKFQKNFMDTIDSQEFKLYKKKINNYGFGQDVGITDYIMFAEKLSPEIADFLAEKNLLKRKDKGVFSVEENSASIYMSMLADYLACISTKDLVIPSTDEKEYERITYQIADKKVLTHRIELYNCLPTPNTTVTIKEIVNFKSKRQQELLQFRELLDSAEADINQAENDQERKLKMIKFKEKVEKEILEIKKLLGDSKLDFVLNGLSSLLDFKQKEVIGTISGLGVVGAGVISSLPFVGLGAGAVLLTGTLISSFRKIHRDIETNSSSYIYYAQKDQILAK